MVGFVTHTPANGNLAAQNNKVFSDDAIANPLDQLSSADIAVHVARMTNLDEAIAVANHADSVNAQLAVAPVDEAVAPKPQIVASSLKSKKDIVTYKVAEGDTVTSVANAYGVTSDSVRWSNGISGDNLSAGDEIMIPPVNGIVYEVKSGDTIDKIVEKYSSDKQKLVVMNDAELGGLIEGEHIIIPDGIQPIQRSYVPTIYSSRTAVYGPYNGYDYGQCTWHTANRRRDAGNPVPNNLGNAESWYRIAASNGIPTGVAPRAGAVIWHVPGYKSGWLGHVAYVEKLNADGSILVSDMNFGGSYASVTYRTVPVHELTNYRFIY